MADDLVLQLIERRVWRLAHQCFKEMQRLRGREYTVYFGNVAPRVQAQYIRLAGFIIMNKLHPRLYLRVMYEYSVNFYVTNLYGKNSMEKYLDYMEKIKRRYRTVKNYNVNDSSLNILRNDLYTVAGICNPLLDPMKFFTDENGQFAQLSLLKKHINVLVPIVDPKTVPILRDILRCGSISKSKYYKQIVEASNVKWGDDH